MFNNASSFMFKDNLLKWKEKNTRLPIIQTNIEDVNEILNSYKYEFKILEKLPEHFKNCVNSLSVEYITEIIHNKCIVLTYTDTIVGLAYIEKKGSIGDIELFYVYFRCVLDTDILTQLTINNKKTFISHGRMLWCYILKHIKKQTNTSFVVYNETIFKAREYHRKMGMKTLSEYQALSEYQNEENETIINAINNKIKPTSKNLFFFSKEIDYSNILEILKSLDGWEVFNRNLVPPIPTSSYGGIVYKKTFKKQKQKQKQKQKTKKLKTKN